MDEQINSGNKDEDMGGRYAGEVRSQFLNLLS